MKRIIFISIFTVLFAKLSAIETEKLNYIGMPVGGIGSGQVYLGGDGQLWYWDVFNIKRINPGGPGDKFYLNPMVQDQEFDQGFAIRLKGAITPTVKALRTGGFADISFLGQYPVGNVSYREKGFPLEVGLKAFTPFIPTNYKESAFPAIIMEYTIKNTGDENVEAELFGWLQNTANYFTSKGKRGKHINSVIKNENKLQLVCTSSGNDLTDLPDSGNMTLTLLNPNNGWSSPSTPADISYNLPEVKKSTELEAKISLGEKLTGVVGELVELTPGQEKTVSFMLTWYYPNLHRNESGFHNLKGKANLRYAYSSRFGSSADVAAYISDNFQYLSTTTKDWANTWYNSTLPTWFLDRTFLNTSTLATTACYLLDDTTDDPDNEGRFYAMEGVYLGHGTCTHVFHYEQALGRVFPNLARKLREQVDYGLSFKKDGVIAYRGELSGMGRHDGRGYAVDGHAGTILRAYREHTMAPDNSFLKNNWSKIKKGIQYMIDHDKEKTGKADGILEGIQYNTLDRMWYGKIAWISGLYAASLKAGAQMAAEVGDKAFAKTCTKLSKLAYENISKELFDGEYFIQKLDPDHLDAPNSNIGCHIDQLLGQYWSTQMGLGDIVPNQQVKSALKSIVKYNYVDNYGEFLANTEIPIKRWYGDDDEQGVIMCSFPKGGADKAPGKINNEWEKLVVGYFSEFWTGQEHQLAAALISEGLIEEALKVEKAVHNRYSAERRNPYNEIEYGNHYTRAMSGYAPFVSASGFIYNGPQGVIGFKPKMDAENFKSAFITAEGWGSFSQKVINNKMVCAIELVYGKLKLNELHLAGTSGKKPQTIEGKLNGEEINIKFTQENNSISLGFDEISLTERDKLEITIY